MGGFEFNSCKKEFLYYLQRMAFSSETVKGYDKDLDFFGRFMAMRTGMKDLQVDFIQKNDLVAFMDYGRDLGHKPNTIARRMATLKSFYKFLVIELDYPVDVAARIKLPRVYVPLRDILTVSEVQRLLDESRNFSPFYHLFFSTLYYTGSRLTPVRTLRLRDVHLNERIFYFPRIKGGKDLYLPIHQKLMPLYESYFERYNSEKYVFPSSKIESQPISAADVRSKLRRIAERAGIKKRVTPHSLRHCTGTHLTINKVDQRSIAAILGHSDLRSTVRYQHLSIEHLREPINCLE